MTLLFATALLWLLLHVGVSGTVLRDRLVGVFGEAAFRGVFAVLSPVVLVAQIYAYDAAQTSNLWVTPGWAFWVADAVMLVAFVLFVGSLSPQNPTMLGAGAVNGEPRGMFRITRHPMLCAFGLWAAVHLLTNGDTASLVFFGTFLLTVLAGIPSLDAKLARRDPAVWAELASHTSRVPFAAILGGRNRLALGEIRWWVPVAGVLAWAAMLYLHAFVIGVAATPP
jgi:uncharacterized membrane protein